MGVIAECLTTFCRTFADDLSRQLKTPTGCDGAGSGQQSPPAGIDDSILQTPIGAPGAWNSTDPKVSAPDTTVGMDCPVCDHLKAMCAVQWDLAELIGRHEPFDVPFIQKYVVPLLTAQRAYQEAVNALTGAVTGRPRAKWDNQQMSDMFDIDLK